jgi:uncharacterized protein (TIGR04255 family)
MGNELHFKNAPIVEAILGIETETLPPEFVERFRELAVALNGAYPDLEPVHISQFTLNANDASSQVAKTQLCYRARSVDGKQVVQFRTNGFAYSRLEPYTSWPEFSSEARRLWEEYKSVVVEPKVTTLALRYINKFFLPIGPDLESYLRVYPYFPQDFPVKVANYFFRMEIELDKPTGRLIMQQATLPPEKEGKVTLVVDNDFRFPSNNLDDGLIWSIFEESRQLKNDVFLRIITDRTKDLIS